MPLLMSSKSRYPHHNVRAAEAHLVRRLLRFDDGIIRPLGVAYVSPDGSGSASLQPVG